MPDGTQDDPLTHMPTDVPYGAWCRCSRCGLVHRSTITFDCYGGLGEPLTCENCHVGQGWTREGVRAFEDELFGTAPKEA